MEIAILVFFLAIFGGVLFLLALVWFIFRRVRKSRAASRNLSGSSNDGGGAASDNYLESDDDADAIYAGGALLANEDAEDRTVRETVQENLPQSENIYSQESSGASAAPAESSYTETSYSSYDSSSSYDSGSSSSDSSSSSSDSGSSSSD